MASTRFPGKPLVDLCGKPMIQWVVEAARASTVSERIIVASPDQEILDSCRVFDCEAILTSDQHTSGTDRIAEVAEKVMADLFVNVQGDEPLISPTTIKSCADVAMAHPNADMSSIYCSCTPDEEDNPAVVKVVTDLNEFALYFSRFAIPYIRGTQGVKLKRHVGIYSYRREPLLAFQSWPPSPLEQAESLEQLRFLENGKRIKMAYGEASAMAVDTPEQAESVRGILESMGA